MEDRFYFLGFSVFDGIGPKRFYHLYTTSGSAKDAWKSTDAEIINALGNSLGEKFITFRKSFSIKRYVELLIEKEVGFLTVFDEQYPRLLASIPNPPFVLYYKGNSTVLNPEAGVPIGIVGTRRITSYGREITEMITEALVRSGVVIVSGLAMGVDAIAHQKTLELDGKTVAVLGSGVDVCHPVVNKVLYKNIIERESVVVSEYPIGRGPTKGSFPSRNRIIAGISQGVVVTEGASDSGALITATDAATFERKVFAVPGPITSSLSHGPNLLLSKGAQLVMSGEDILAAIGLSSKGVERSRTPIVGDTVEEQKIIKLLQNDSLLFDELVKKSGYTSAITSMHLSHMEMKGFIRNNEGRYVLLS